MTTSNPYSFLSLSFLICVVRMTMADLSRRKDKGEKCVEGLGQANSMSYCFPI